MGGDRDGNPFVTPETTRDVVITARLSAVNLFFDAIEQLMFELSNWRCSDEMRVTHQVWVPITWNRLKSVSRRFLRINVTGKRALIANSKIIFCVWPMQGFKKNLCCLFKKCFYWNRKFFGNPPNFTFWRCRENSKFQSIKPKCSTAV